ncbi:telomerase reverse transcriptase-like [Ptychodera flava]|uniref:telomerase reverse transcriptase-like n=1 Tax=Ptychodera flava TaxID=63121 RepID=UPI00396A5D15
MERVLAQLDTDSYTLRYYSVVGVHQDSIFRHHKWSVSSLSDFQPDIIKHVSKERQKSRSYSNKVVIELNVNQVEKVGALLQKLQRHIQGNVVKIAGKFYFQITGIPQGSVLSTLLCSYFYGDMEQKFLTGIDEDGLLLRMVDDFLLVTPHISQAKKFLEIMSSGIPEYGCRINTKKTVANFALDRQDCTVTCLENLALFPWCGMLINTQTLEVYGDYSGYENLDMKDTITLDLTKNPGQSILNKLQHTIRLKCHALFVDHQVNSTATIITNLHRLFQLTASRLHCIAQQLPPHHRVADNPKYFNRLLLQLGQYTHNLASAAGTNTVETFPLSKPAVIWLCFRTFKTRLELHRPVYHSLLKLISVELQRNVEKVNPRTLKQLEAVLNMSGSVMSELL